MGICFKSPDLKILEENKIITNSEKNLRSKIESILTSIEQLSRKKVRIEFEIKRQKKSLIRKRAELKRVTTSNRKKLKIALEESNLVPNPTEIQYEELIRYDSSLLQRSNRVLEELDS